MKKTRREFLDTAIKTTAVLPLMNAPFISKPLEKGKTNQEKKKILILGGTSFLGPHQVKYAVDRGHEVSIFVRGKTNPTVNTQYFEGDKIERLIGDREDNLEALKNRKWDAVIDNSGRKVKWTKDTAELLVDNVDQYIYTSSVSVFYPYYKMNVNEDDPIVLKIPDSLEDEGEKQAYDYGVMKGNSELAASKVFGASRTTVVRPTFMFGPADRTNRFMYWPLKLAAGGDVILPGSADQAVQFIDVRDIAEWMIRIVENKTAGTFNGVGPNSKMTTDAFVYGAHAAFSSACNFIKIDDPAFLEEHNLSFVAPWVRKMDKYEGMSFVDNRKAIKAGLTFRPLAQLLKDTYEWWQSDAVTDERRDKFLADENGLFAKESAILEAWASR